MPAHRRRPTPQPSRRPQVAGLRRPGERPTPRPRPRPYSAQEEDTQADELPADGTQAPTDFVEEAPAAPVAEPEVPDDEQPEVAEETELEPDEVASVPAAPSRPAPRAKARDTGVLKPGSEQEIEPGPEAADLPTPPARTRPRDAMPFLIAVALGVVFAIAAGLLAWQYFDARSVSENKAQVDPLTSDQIQTDVKEAIKTLFSYDHSKLEGRAEDVNDVLASGKLKDQFAALNCAVEDQAPKQQIITSTQVSYSAVTEQTDDTAKLIVFVENVWERKSTKQKGSGAGSLGVTAKMVGDEWKIEKLDIYGGETGKEPKVPDKCK